MYGVTVPPNARYSSLALANAAQDACEICPAGFYSSERTLKLEKRKKMTARRSCVAVRVRKKEIGSGFVHDFIGAVA